MSNLNNECYPHVETSHEIWNDWFLYDRNICFNDWREKKKFFEKFDQGLQ